MLEEQQKTSAKVTNCHPQKQLIIHMNNQIVKLLNLKLIPLNKVRYSHLQRINQAIPKNIFHKHSSTPSMTVDFNQSFKKLKIKLKPIERNRTERGTHQNTKIATDRLINPLKNLKQLKQSTHLMKQDEKAGQCWQTLRNTILKSQNINISAQTTSRQGLKSNRRRKRENLMQLTERANQYLRLKKHELRLKSLIQSEGVGKLKLQKRQMQIQSMLAKRRTVARQNNKISQSNQKELQKQLLRDIRKNMLETNLNRMKLNINHKKIVDMR